MAPLCRPQRRPLSVQGGTSLSKAYGVIRRFSEDVDLTYDIRAIASDLVGDTDAPLPASKSQKKKWSREIRARLSDWVSAEIMPRLKHDLEQQGLPATVRAKGDKVFIDYTPLATGTGYVAPAVMLEFGTRSTGKPSEPRVIHCGKAAPYCERARRLRRRLSVVSNHPAIASEGSCRWRPWASLVIDPGPFGLPCWQPRGVCVPEYETLDRKT